MSPPPRRPARFGYTPGSFRVLVHQFRNQPERDFFIPPPHEGRPPGKQNRLREQVIALRKQNLSVHDISRALAREGESLSPAAVAAILKEEGFAKLPRRLDDERPDQPRPVVADVADVRQLDLTPRTVPHQVRRPVPLPALAGLGRPGRAPGTRRLPRIEDGPGRAAPCGRCWRLKLFGNARHSHVMSSVLDEGLALFAGLNVDPQAIVPDRIQLPDRTRAATRS